MAIELITGRYGTAHIGSEDVRAYQAYTAGSGRYVLHGGGATIQSANNIRVNPAEILIDGAHVRITGTGEDVTIDNGASSYKRVDIIALHYKMTGNGDAAVESITLDVVKGTPADSDPQDPDMPASGSILNNVSETYVPYIRVMIDGLTPQTPTVLLDQYALPEEHGGTGVTSIDQVNYAPVDDSLFTMKRTFGVGLYTRTASWVWEYISGKVRSVFGFNSSNVLTASHGGTGQTSLQATRNAMGLGNTSGALPVANGGTGATSAGSARANLKAAGYQGDLTYGYLTSNNAADQYLQIVGNNSNGKTRTLVVGETAISLWKSDENASAGSIPWSRKNRALEAYPVGAVYISYSSTSPASLFGGTWTPITGKFPYFNAGTGTGGSNTTTLAVKNLPSHNHSLPRELVIYTTSGNLRVNGAADYTALHTIDSSNVTGNQGSGTSFNNMPSYQTLYAWRRTA